MTTPKPIVSPAVRRALEAQASRGHSAKQPVEPTLGDRIPADKAPACQG